MQTIPANEKLVGMKIVPKGRFSARDRQRNNEKLSAKFFVNCYISLNERFKRQISR